MWQALEGTQLSVASQPAALWLGSRILFSLKGIFFTIYALLCGHRHMISVESLLKIFDTFRFP